MPDLSNHLPIQPTPFIGREKEVAAVLHQLLREDVRLVTLTGPGGVGKTRIALHVAEQVRAYFADGIWFVSLAPISEPDLVIPTIAQTLGLWEVGEQSLLEQPQVFLREKQVLLLLDNFEQVASAAKHVADLLTNCPHLKVLVTSREALHVRAEHEFLVPTLSLPDPKRLPDLVALSQYEAVVLFMQRAQAVKHEFEMTNVNASAVAEICVRLDGLPLAIELAATRIKLLHPQALLTRLGRRLQLLTSNARDVPARQQTLRNMIQWSYDLLDAQEQRLFCLLSVFVGGCTLVAVEEVSAALGDIALPVLDGVISLIDKSLLQQTAQEGEEVRFLMLETIREYGWEVLDERQEKEASQAAHAAYYLALAEEAELALGGPQQLLWLERLGREYDNLRAALHWLRLQGNRVEGGGSAPLLLPLPASNARRQEAAEQALRLETALSWFWTIRGYQNDGRRRPRQLFLDLEETLATEEVVPVPPLTKIWQPPAPPARETPPAGLRAREVDVLRLLAQGLTDAQIAEQLVLARRTVNWYLTSIYSKIGVSSRSAATRYAIEHHLV